MEVQVSECPICTSEESEGKLTSQEAIEVNKITNSMEAGLRYILSSAKFPLGCGLVVTLGLSGLDCFERHSISPLLVAPITCFCYMIYDKEWSSASNPRSLQLLAVMPFVYILVTEFLLKFRTSLHTVAVWHMQPPFLALLARDVPEAGVYLVIHALVVAHISVPNYFSNLCALLLNDVVLIASVSIKEDITKVARTLLSHNRILSRYSSEACSDVDHARRVALNLPSDSGASQKVSREDQLAQTSVQAVANSGDVAPELQPGNTLTVEELQCVERDWANNEQEPDFDRLEAMCLAGNIDASVAPWLLRRWAWAELQLQQQMEQIQRIAASSNHDLDRFARIIGDERPSLSGDERPSQ